MPIPPSSAYVTVESVTNLIRALANDMIYSQAGEVLTDTANFMFPLLNDSLEWFTNEVNNHGINTFTKETYLLSLAPAVSTPAQDPGIEVHVDDLGYFNGTTYVLQPQVPTDLLVPLFLWERQSGSTEAWVEMKQCLDGLPACQWGDRFRMWEWRQDGIYMPGAIQTNDLRLRYNGSQATLLGPTDTLYFRGATGPLAYKTVSSYLASKNPEASELAAAEAMRRVSQLCTRNARMKQRDSVTRISYGSTGGGRTFYPPRNP